MNPTAEATTRATGSDLTTRRPNRHFKVVVVGAGNAGISVAARLANVLGSGEVAIVDSATTHFYQPLWTLVGGGVVDKQRSARPQSSVIPKGCNWIQQRVQELDPQNNRVITEGGETIGYDFLVVAAGIELDWDGIEGLAGALGSNGVCSNYSFEHVDYTWQTIKNFSGGTALFTMPPPPIKCAGAPQKIAYLADDAFRKQGVRERSKIIYAAGTPGIFAVPDYAKTLNQVLARKQIDTRFEHVLVAIDAAAKAATFEYRANGNQRVTIDYEMIHVTPPQRAPRVVRESPLAGDGGWLEVDKHTLRSPTHENVFALGDCSSLPTSKTGAAIRKQAPVAVANLLSALGAPGHSGGASYDGYTACPLVTGYGKLVMAEFDYDGKPAPSFPIDQTKERWSMYQVKRHLLPQLYWKRILSGKS